MRVGEVCAGYGGLTLAMRQAGWPAEVTWVAEVDPSGSTVLAAHHPHAPNHGDITKVDWSAVEPVDVLAGGIPCQPWSAAGKRAGSLDERDLWPVRKQDDEGRPRRGFIDAVRKLKPPVVVFENVAALVRAESGKPWGVILTDLAEAGYDAAWVTVGACLVGACHHRHRVFLVARPHGGSPGVQASSPVVARLESNRWTPWADTLFGDPAPVVWPKAGVMTGGVVRARPVDVCVGSAAALPTPTARDADRGAGWGDPQLSAAVHRMLPTPTARVADGRGTPSEATAAARMEAGRRNLEDAVALLPTPRATDAEKGGPNQRGSAGDLALPAAVQPARFGAYDGAVRRHEAAFGLPAPDPTEPGRSGRPRLAAGFTEWMQGLWPGYLTRHVGRSAAIRLAGNGVNTLQGAYALGLLEPTPLPEVADNPA